MAGRGPAPKPAARRARTNKDPVPAREVTRTTTAGPAAARVLPIDLLGSDEEWHPATLRWWARWCESPLSEHWTEVDWSELEACALLHQEFMKRRTFTLASEIRLRVAKFGATPEDRMRLRITFADPEDPKLAPAGVPPVTQWGNLRALPGA